MIISGIIRWKLILLRNRTEDEKILFNITWDRPFSPRRPRIGIFPYVLTGWLVDAYLSGVFYQRTLNLCKNFQFIGNFKVTYYFVIIIRPHFQWQEFHIKIHDMAGKQCSFLHKVLYKGCFCSFGWNFKFCSVDIMLECRFTRFSLKTP